MALERADIILFSGGLGPTEDDLTREAVAEVLERELQRDPEIIAHIAKMFAARRMKMSDNNMRQADIIAGATMLPNPLGTAPGQWLTADFEGRNKLLILLPGPPHEQQKMFEEQCLGRLRAVLPPLHIATRLRKVAMIGESLLDTRIAPIYKRYPEVQTTILAAAGEIQIHLRARAASQEEAEDRVERLVGEIEDELDDAIFSRGEETLEQIVGYYLQMREATVAVAESCTGGLLGQRITSIGGSSRYFRGGAIVYSNELKTTFTGVHPRMIEEYGAVSREVASALAQGIRQRCDATYGIGITGIAGPAGGTEQKPVGTVYVALADRDSTQVIEKIYPGDRSRIRWFATQQALDMLRRKLM
jgi:nicotinamide-nucleotide amidase